MSFVVYLVFAWGVVVTKSLVQPYHAQAPWLRFCYGGGYVWVLCPIVLDFIRSKGFQQHWHPPCNIRKFVVLRTWHYSFV